jgi:putative membrane protein
VSYAVELLGVHTGAVFGDYEYGSALGPTLWGVPPIIGVLWFVLAYGVGHLTARSSLGRAGRAAMGAALLTALDWLIEPTAIRLGFWSWRDGVPPTLNFVGWFALSFCLVYAFHALRLPRENPLAERSLALLALFFAALAGFA